MPPVKPEPSLIATYRLQLRCGVDLDKARSLLPWLGQLGVSHLYLSPPFEAASGSTHGYDVIDPTRIDPALGGDAAFERLADEARTAGIGLILDIVPNHMAFTPENPYLAEVLRDGRDNRYAAVFDFDWDACSKNMEGDGRRIHFPVLDAPPEELLAQGQISVSGSMEDPKLRVYEREYPLRRTDLAKDLSGSPDGLNDETLTKLLAEQHWSLGHWRTDADRIVHRRFFNISDLIGVRQEDPEVFALTHSWIIQQVAAGRIQGLRVDHIDGLARPSAYLHHLREAVGDVPIWVEKIVKEHEIIPASWPVEGMSGYEFMTPVTRVLTAPEGLSAMREAGRKAMPAFTTEEVANIRLELLRNVFRPELSRVTEAAIAALSASADQRTKISEALARLASIWPVYRSYAADLCPLSSIVTDAVAHTRSDAVATSLLDLLRAADDPLARAFAARFEQLTGALTAKSEEDTAFFRSVAFLPLCEVGSEPSLDAIDAPCFERLMIERATQTPYALTALSTHDTKRSADARAVLIALSHFPDLAQDLYRAAGQRANDGGLPERWGIYALQAALMLRRLPDAQERISAHLSKAMREAKDHSSHEAPDEGMEAAVADLACSLLRSLDDGSLYPRTLDADLDAAIETTVLAQVALQLTAPGVPDIYQGTEVLACALTDPDNRRLVPWDDLAALPTDDTADLSSRKLALTRDLLARRRASPLLFTQGAYKITKKGHALIVERRWEDEVFTLTIPVAAPANALAGVSVSDRNEE